MHAQQVSHKILQDTLPKMHKKRFQALVACVNAALESKTLTVTGIGRSIDNDSREKHRIKQADRLLSNVHLHTEHQAIYQHIITYLVGSIQRPVILVDWSDLDPFGRHYLLRASLASQGRAHTLYEEVHTLKTKDKPASHKQFMHQLKTMLPSNCKPIVVTDAGFRVPWFKLIISLGWDYVGRVRNRTMMKRETDESWYPIKQIYPLATTTAKNLGEVEMARANPLTCQMVLYKAKPKGRHSYNRMGERAIRQRCKIHFEREKEPWLLATSLPVTSKLAKKVVHIYATRMQIEESFRDIKSYRYGIGFELNMSQNTKRLKILLMIGMLAMLLLWLLGAVAQLNGQAKYYQANTVTKRRVLSTTFLGLRVYKDRRFRLKGNELTAIYHQLIALSNEHGYGW
jgi:hypothetical protein